MSDGSGDAGGLPFGGEVRQFSLKNGGLFKIENECDESAFAIHGALVSQRPRTNWIKSVIVNGLIGGGASAGDANALFKIHVEDTEDWNGACVIAAIVLTSGLSGPVLEGDDDDAGKPAGEAPKN